MPGSHKEPGKPFPRSRIPQLKPLNFMPEFRPYSDLPTDVDPSLQRLIDAHPDVLAIAILPSGSLAMKRAYELRINDFSDFEWADYVFSDLADRGKIRGFICAKNVTLMWQDQVTLAAGGEAVF